MTPENLKIAIAGHAEWLKYPKAGRRADLRGANLFGADLRGADLRGADLRGANLSGARGLIDAGHDPRGYEFIGVPQNDGTLRIKAGCRWFTLEEARSHWTESHNRDALLRVDFIAAAAEVYRQK